jgi:putative CocE/NonD family hydrolase
MSCEANPAETAYRLKAKYNTWIPMRDGVRLSADVYLPDKDGKYPVLLMRTYYGKCNNDLASGGIGEFVTYFVERGYAVVIQDCRGRYDSEGEFYIEIYDFDDGYDTVEWCAKQEWSNGRVGMFGCSYPGCIQLSAAVSENAHLKCIAPRDATSDSYLNGGFMRRGVVQGWLDWCLHTAGRTTREQLRPKIAWDKAYQQLPLNKLDENLGFMFPYWKDYFKHPSYDEYWDRFSYEKKHDRISAASLNIGGWYSSSDIDGTISNFLGITQKGKKLPAGTHHKLILGPWPHCKTVRSYGEHDFGEEAVPDMREVHRQWFDYWLKDKDTGIMNEPPIKYFLMGANRWCTAHAWPPEGSSHVHYYLHSRGRANSLLGDGYLSLEPPGNERHDQFTYDPYNPVPFAVHAPADGEEHAILDQRVIERRDDVLVYTTAPFVEDVNVVGPVRLRAHASSSAVDTDFVAKLVDVHPNDMAIFVTIGVVRARYRTSLEQPTLMQPGTVYEFDIDMSNTANQFKKGHSMRLEVSSSAFPYFLKNQNTGNEIGTDTESAVARQRIFHDLGHESHLDVSILAEQFSPKTTEP